MQALKNIKSRVFLKGEFLLVKKTGSMAVYISYVLLISAYFLCCLVRTSGGVVLPGISSAMGLSPSLAGLISGMYFYGYTITQPFCGKMCDNKGSLFMESCGIMIFASGLALFAIADNALLLCAARFLLGIGAGPTFCSLMVFQAKALPSHLFSKFMGITIMLGHFGGVVSVTPLGFAIDKLGYKNVHYILAALSVAVFILLLLMLRRLPFEKEEAAASRKGGVLHGFGIMLKNRQLTVLVIVWSIMMITQMNLIGLWGVYWIRKTCHMSESIAIACMSMGGIGVLVGAFVVGIAGTVFSKSIGFLRGFYIMMTAVLALLILCVSCSLPWQLLAVITFVIGTMFGIINVLCNVFVYKIVGADVVGTVTGACNVVLFLSVLLSQCFSGAFIQKLDSAACLSGYSSISVFFVLLVILASVVLLPFFYTDYKKGVRKKPCSDQAVRSRL